MSVGEGGELAPGDLSACLLWPPCWQPPGAGMLKAVSCRLPAPHARPATTAPPLASPALLGSAALASSASVGPSSPTALWET